MLWGCVFELLAQRRDYREYDFSRADSIAASLRGKKYPLTDLSAQLTSNLGTDIEKIRAIYVWIAENIAYDVVEFHKSKEIDRRYSRRRKKRYDEKRSKNVSKRTLRKKKAICYGYAYLFKEMTSSVGIASHLVVGYARTGRDRIGKSMRPNHAWNIVYVDHQWYPIDATWSSGYTNEKVTHFTFSFDDYYFLTDPQTFIRSHYPEDKIWTMDEDPISIREFFNSPKVLKGATENKINRFAPENGVIRAKADSTIQFFFTSNKDAGLKWASFYFLSMKTGREVKGVLPVRKILTKTDTGYFAEVTMPKKGRYEVRIYLDTRPSFAYDAYIQ